MKLGHDDAATVAIDQVRDLAVGVVGVDRLDHDLGPGQVAVARLGQDLAVGVVGHVDRASGVWPEPPNCSLVSSLSAS